MPQIPFFESQGTAQIGTSLPHADPAAFGAAAGAAAEGFGQVAGTFGAWEDRYAEARRAMDASDIIAGASAKLGDAQFRWSKTPDRVAAGQGFSQESTALRSQILGSISDPLVKAHVTSQLDQEIIARGLQTQSDAFRLESSKRVGDLDTNLATYAQSAATAGNDHLRDIVTDNALGAIRGAVAGGWMTPEAGAQRTLQFRSSVQRVSAEQERNAALASRDPQAALDWAKKVNDPTSYPGLLPQDREVLGQRAETIAWRLSVEAAARTAHADAVADRDMRRAQATNEATLLASAYGGKLADLGTLTTMVQRQQISAGGLEAIHRAGLEAQEGHDEPLAANQLWGRLLNGEDVHEDAIAAYNNRQLSGRTLVQMTQAAGRRDDKGDSALARASFGQLKTALSGGAVEQGIIPDKAPEAALWAQAQGEWAKRVVAGSEDPQAVLADMLPRYSRDTPAPTWLPAPRLGGIASPQDLDAVAAATVKARDAGQIDSATYDGQVALLNQYKQFYDRQQQRRTALAPPPAAKKSGGAKLLGVTSGD